MVSDIENYVTKVIKLSALGSYTTLAQYVNDINDRLTKNCSLLDNVLEIFNIRQHSIGILYVLIAKFNSAPPEPNGTTMAMLNLFKNFINDCDIEQLRIVAHGYYELCHLFTAYIVDKPQCQLGIKPLAKAVEKIRQFDTQLTPVHADLCQLSLKAINFKLALKLLDIDITTISTASDSCNISTRTIDANTDSKYFLLYYYYGGMIYTAIRNFERALFFYEVCLSTPGTDLSQIVLEAFKKYVLVSLILHGKIEVVLKCPASPLVNLIRPHVNEYYDLAKAYATMSPHNLQYVVHKFSDVYTRDKHMGLVKQVLKSLFKKNIQRLTKTFVMLSLEDIAVRAQIPTAADAENLILCMIKSEEISATIDQKNQKVDFKEIHCCELNSPEMFLKIHNDLEKIVKLVKEINTLEEEILLDPAFMRKVLGTQDDELKPQQRRPSA